eukprot:1838638-Pyramimonas_sp.AAC.1
MAVWSTCSACRVCRMCWSCARPSSTLQADARSPSVTSGRRSRTRSLNSSVSSVRSPAQPSSRVRQPTDRRSFN